MAWENTHNSPGRFYFTFKCTDKWTASALPRDPATASSHPASLQDTLCPFSSLHQLFCPFPVWLSADDLIFLFTGQTGHQKALSPPLSFLTSVSICLLCPLSCCKFPVIPVPMSCHALCLSPGLPSSSPTQACVCVCLLLSRVWLFETPRTVALQASLSISALEFSRQEYWSGLPFASPKKLPSPGIEPWSPASQADSLLFELQGTLTHSRTDYSYLLFHESPVWLSVSPGAFLSAYR